MNKHLILATLAPSLLLAGCVSFGAEPPESLLTLTPTATAPAGVGFHREFRCRAGVERI